MNIVNTYFCSYFSNNCFCRVNVWNTQTENKGLNVFIIVFIVITVLSF